MRVSCVEEPSTSITTIFQNMPILMVLLGSCYFAADKIFNSIYLKLLFINSSI